MFNTLRLSIEVLAELKAWVKIRRLKELKVFNSLRLSIVVAVEVLADVLTDVTTDVAADITAKAITSRLGYCSRGLNIN